MTAGLSRPATTPRRWRTAGWVAFGLGVIVAVAVLGSFLTASGSGGRMDPTGTGPDGAHALVALLRDRGIEVVVADTVADVERGSAPDTLVLVAETARIADPGLLQRLAGVPGNLLLVQPAPPARSALAPEIRTSAPDARAHQPDCALRAANRAGTVALRNPRTYTAAGDQRIDSCYGGALVRYRSGDRVVTVVGSAWFLTNSGLPVDGNAALAMNLTGAQPRLVWYAPQRIEGAGSGSATVADLIPANVIWLVGQLCLAVALTALWQGRRLGPLVTEQLPVVVRASETVEGHGRLYRSARARDRAAQALRIALLQRLLPRLGLNAAAPPPVVATVLAQRTGAHPDLVGHLLFGPPPDSDADLVRLSRALDDIERQVMRP